MHQLSKNLEVTCLRCLCVKGFPFVIVVAERGFPEVADWLTVQSSFVVMSWEANCWALAEDAELWLVEVLRQSHTRRQGVAAKLKLRTRNSQRKRKETKVKERKDVTRLGGFSSHCGSSWHVGQSMLKEH